MKTLSLGFIVEGDTDKIIVETLAQRLLSHPPIDFQFYTVRLGSKAALSSAYTTVWLFLEKGYEHIVLLFDADTTNKDEVFYQKSRVEKTLLENHIELSKVVVCPVIPEIEAWLLAHYFEFPEEHLNSRTKLKQITQQNVLSPQVLRAIAEQVDLELLEQRSSSFAEFAHALRTIAEKDLQFA